MSGRFRWNVSWRTVFNWYGVVLVLATFGTVLAYHGPLSSDAWRVWSGPGAWKRDVLRALIGAMLSVFVLWNLGLSTAKQVSEKEGLGHFHFRRYEFVLLGSATALLLLFTFVFLPESFKAGLDQRHSEIPKNFRQIMMPYFPYLLYMLGLWLGIVFPVFLVLLRRAIQDQKEWHKARARQNRSCLKPPLSGADVTSEKFGELAVAFQDYVIRLKEIAQRYVPVLLAISIYLLYEQLTSSHKTLTTVAADASKVALWLLLGPALLICVVVVALGYQSAAQEVDSAFHTFAEVLLKSPEKAELLDRVIKARSELTWNQSPTSFVLSVVKSASVSIPLLLAITAYVLKSLAGPEGWLGVFVPKAFINFLQNLYK